VKLAGGIRAAVEDGSLDTKGCGHFVQVRDVVPSAVGCEDCLKIGDEWVNLRLCLTCGHVGCCDNSKNKHATKHYHATHHPVIVSYEEGESWLWCYVDEVGIDP
jgi:uncharacterized UBP type Zn finger protein